MSEPFDIDAYIAALERQYGDWVQSSKACSQRWLYVRIVFIREQTPKNAAICEWLKQTLVDERNFSAGGVFLPIVELSPGEYIDAMAPETNYDPDANPANMMIRIRTNKVPLGGPEDQRIIPDGHFAELSAQSWRDRSPLL